MSEAWSPIDIGHDLEDGGNHSQVAGDGLLPGDQGQALGFDAALHIVDVSVVTDDLLRQGLILVFDGKKEVV